MNKTGIKWTELTSNPIYFVDKDGTPRRQHHCEKVSPGCANCWAERVNLERFNGLPYDVPSTSMLKPVLNESELEKWKRTKKEKMMFACSMTDLWGGFIPNDMRVKVYEAAERSPLVTIQFLTKRAKECVDWVIDREYQQGVEQRPPENIWLGFSAENQKYFDERWGHFKRLARQRRVIVASLEPLLGPIVLPDDFLALGQRGQVIIGGESDDAVKIDDRTARPMHPFWARNIIRQCKDAGVPVLFKQWGQWMPVSQVKSQRNRLSDYCMVPLNGTKSIPSLYVRNADIEMLVEHANMIRVGRLIEGYDRFYGKEYAEYPCLIEQPTIQQSSLL